MLLICDTWTLWYHSSFIGHSVCQFLFCSTCSYIFIEISFTNQMDYLHIHITTFTISNILEPSRFLWNFIFHQDYIFEASTNALPFDILVCLIFHWSSLFWNLFLFCGDTLYLFVFFQKTWMKSKMDSVLLYFVTVCTNIPHSQSWELLFSTKQFFFFFISTFSFIFMVFLFRMQIKDVKKMLIFSLYNLYVMD
mgnify:CR=1 FL=1